MAYSWRDLVGKSDTFSNVLPLFNKKGSLEDNYSFKFTAKPKNGKYSLLANHTNGARGRVEFSASETYTNYYNTELGYKINNKPGVELSAKLTDKLVPLEGSSLSLTISSEERQEKASLSFNYANNVVNATVGVSIPLPQRVFNLQVQNDDNVVQNKSVSTELVYGFARDYFFGVAGTYKLPNEGEQPKYDVRALVAQKNTNFEGGVYARKSVDKETSSQLGSYVTVETDNLTLSSNFDYEFNKNQFRLDNFVSLPGQNGQRYLLGYQVFPQTSLSFGVEKVLDSTTKISFAYAYVISKEESVKRSAFRVGIELTN